MKILPPEHAVDLYNEGFDVEDILQRRRVSAALSNLLSRVDDPVVVALDGGWGTGKTYFLRRWVGAHKIDNGANATTIYFDAFSHDYLSDPLPALVTALSERLPNSKSDQLNKLKSAALKLAKPIARVGLALATFGATEALSDYGDRVAEVLGEEANEELGKYWAAESSRRLAIEEFKGAIKSIVEPDDLDEIGSTIIFVIDELDRCRPDYALEILEVIKHFFSVDHLHFVLGVNLNALENSVSCRYGEKIDAKAYLKKFINITLKLPDEIGDNHNIVPLRKIYFENCAKEMGIPKHISDQLDESLSLASRSHDVSIRDIGQILSSACLLNPHVISEKNMATSWLRILSDLIVSKIINPNMYEKFLHSEIREEDLIRYFNINPNFEFTIEVNQSELYSRSLEWKFYTWIMISKNEALAHTNEKFRTAIEHQFDHFSLNEREVENFPMKIHRLCLDQFSFYSE